MRVMLTALFSAGILQLEADGLAELAGARRAETHDQRCCNTERRDAELTLHAGLSFTLTSPLGSN